MRNDSFIKEREDKLQMTMSSNADQFQIGRT